MKNLTIGNQVVRTKGDYTIGRVGNVISIDTEKNKVQVEWFQATWEDGSFEIPKVKTWVKSDCITPTDIPYRLEFYKLKNGLSAIKYIKL